MKKVQLRYQQPRYAIVRRRPVRDILKVATPSPPLSKVQADERAALFAPAIRDIINATSKATGISVFDIVSPRRAKRICHARQAIMIMARKYTALSYPQIGRHLGGRDHSTIQHAIIRNEKNPEIFASLIQSVLNLLPHPADNGGKAAPFHQLTDNCAMV